MVPTRPFPSICSYKCNSDPAVCKECQPYALRIDGVCKDCQEAGLGKACNSCMLKAGKPVCINCILGFRVDAKGRCTKCPANCGECTATACTECMHGFKLAEGKCQR